MHTPEAAAEKGSSPRSSSDLQNMPGMKAEPGSQDSDSQELQRSLETVSVDSDRTHCYSLQELPSSPAPPSSSLGLSTEPPSPTTGLAGPEAGPAGLSAAEDETGTSGESGGDAEGVPVPHTALLPPTGTADLGAVGPGGIVPADGQYRAGGRSHVRMPTSYRARKSLGGTEAVGLPSRLSQGGNLLRPASSADPSGGTPLAAVAKARRKSLGALAALSAAAAAAAAGHNAAVGSAQSSVGAPGSASSVIGAHSPTHSLVAPLRIRELLCEALPGERGGSNVDRASGSLQGLPPGPAARRISLGGNSVPDSPRSVRSLRNSGSGGSSKSRRGLLRMSSSDSDIASHFSFKMRDRLAALEEEAGKDGSSSQSPFSWVMRRPDLSADLSGSTAVSMRRTASPLRSASVNARMTGASENPSSLGPSGGRASHPVGTAGEVGGSSSTDTWSPGLPPTREPHTTRRVTLTTMQDLPSVSWGAATTAVIGGETGADEPDASGMGHQSGPSPREGWLAAQEGSPSTPRKGGILRSGTTHTGRTFKRTGVSFAEAAAAAVEEVDREREAAAAAGALLAHLGIKAAAKDPDADPPSPSRPDDKLLSAFTPAPSERASPYKPLGLMWADVVAHMGGSTTTADPLLSDPLHHHLHDQHYLQQPPAQQQQQQLPFLMQHPHAAQQQQQPQQQQQQQQQPGVLSSSGSGEVQPTVVPSPPSQPSSSTAAGASTAAGKVSGSGLEGLKRPPVLAVLHSGDPSNSGSSTPGVSGDRPSTSPVTSPQHLHLHHTHPHTSSPSHIQQPWSRFSRSGSVSPPSPASSGGLTHPHTLRRSSPSPVSPRSPHGGEYHSSRLSPHRIQPEGGHHHYQQTGSPAERSSSGRHGRFSGRDDLLGSHDVESLYAAAAAAVGHVAHLQRRRLLGHTAGWKGQSVEGSEDGSSPRAFASSGGTERYLPHTLASHFSGGSGALGMSNASAGGGDAGGLVDAQTRAHARMYARAHSMPYERALAAVISNRSRAASRVASRVASRNASLAASRCESARDRPGNEASEDGGGGGGSTERSSRASGWSSGSRMVGRTNSVGQGGGGSGSQEGTMVTPEGGEKCGSDAGRSETSPTHADVRLSAEPLTSRRSRLSQAGSAALAHALSDPDLAQLDEDEVSPSASSSGAPPQ